MKHVLLTVHFATPDHPLRHSRVLCCKSCGCRFFENQSPPDYTDAAMLGRGRVAFYLQQGAGLSLITRPLARIMQPPGATYLEVGCGFGFGVDFAIRAKRWLGTGIDPGQIAALGSEMLGIPIEQRYLSAAEPLWHGRCDVVMASETIEHVPSPSAFLGTLRRVLKPGGMLVLTTPDADELQPDKSPGALVPLLSPGLHLVFQNRRSLQELLHATGFAHVEMEKDGTSLVAYASDSPFDLSADAAGLRATYRDYLETRATTAAQERDLFFGFAGRAFQEAVNDANFVQAARVRSLLDRACRDHFNFALDELPALPQEAADCGLERLAELMPLNLGGILYADAISQLAAEVPRPCLSARFTLAAQAADAMRRALGELAMEDGMSENIAAVARAEALLCDAATGLVDVPQRLAAHCVPVLAERAFIAAVNAGHFELGREIAAVAQLNERIGDGASGMTAVERDTMFCLAVLDVQPHARAWPLRGAQRFAAVLRACADDADHLGAAAARGLNQAIESAGDDELASVALHELGRFAGRTNAPEDIKALATALSRRLFVGWVNAGEYQRAQSIASTIATGFDAEGPERSIAARDAAFCLGVLNLQPGGDLNTAADLLAGVRTSLRPPTECDDASLFWAALRGESQAIRRRDGNSAAICHLRYVLADVAADLVPSDLRSQLAEYDVDRAH
jgi:SAM-dependent methyltransferase